MSFSKEDCGLWIVDCEGLIVRSQNVKLGNGNDGNKKMVASIRDENVKLTKCHRPPSCSASHKASY